MRQCCLAKSKTIEFIYGENAASCCSFKCNTVIPKFLLAIIEVILSTFLKRNWTRLYRTIFQLTNKIHRCLTSMIHKQKRSIVKELKAWKFALKYLTIIMMFLCIVIFIYFFTMWVWNVKIIYLIILKIMELLVGRMACPRKCTIKMWYRHIYLQLR